jgi:hypothetical protein
LRWHTRRDERGLQTEHPTALQELVVYFGRPRDLRVIELSGEATARRVKALAVLLENARERGDLMEIAKSIEELGTVYVEVEG